MHFNELGIFVPLLISFRGGGEMSAHYRQHSLWLHLLYVKIDVIVKVRDEKSPRCKKVWEDPVFTKLKFSSWARYTECDI